MNELAKKIYETILLEETQSIHLRKQIDADVAQRFSSFKQSIKDIDWVLLESDIYASCHIAELVGFELGIKFMKRLWGEAGHD